MLCTLSAMFTCVCLNTLFFVLLYQVGDVRFELAVSKTTPTAPSFYNRKEAEDFVHYTFMSFNATAPDSKTFDIPKACQDV